MPAFDLDAYLARIRYDGPLEPDLATLAGLLAAHMDSIHFENIEVLLGRTIPLDVESLQEKIVRGGRGGYCFEQATLFDAALRALGFKTTLRTARVTLVLAPDKAPRGHMIVVIDLPEGGFVADPGLGGLGCRAPIPLDGTPVADRGEINRIVFDGRRRLLQVATQERTVDAWVSGLDADNWVDFEVANHWFATHPASPMRQRLMLRAMTPEGRVTVMNHDITTRANGRVGARRLENRSELRSLLREVFGFDLPEAETLRVPTVPEWQCEAAGHPTEEPQNRAKPARRRSGNASGVRGGVEEPMNDQVEMVRLLAYQLWENAGCPEGRHDDFWFAAEAQIRQAFEAEAMDKPDGTDADPAAAAPDAARPSKAA